MDTLSPKVARPHLLRSEQDGVNGRRAYADKLGQGAVLHGYTHTLEPRLFHLSAVMNARFTVYRGSIRAPVVPVADFFPGEMPSCLT